MRYSKPLITLAAAAVMLVFIGSCKHEILGPASSRGGGGSTPVGNTGDPCDINKIYFQQQALPILVSNCAKSGCHDVASRKEGIILTTYDYTMSTGGIRPGNPGGTEIYKEIANGNMPPAGNTPLTQQQKDLIYNWIQQGAQNLICQNMCDSSVFTFSGAVKNNIQNKCQGCHSGASASGGIDLSTYSLIMVQVSNGKLWGSINQLPGFYAMPKNGSKLSDCEITQIRKWMDAGSLNN
ncbi:MAG: hypothetical protein EPN92_13970 [Chitinophagaceae bacterium]|nr:MAG: hypothetical protein EPN92_13970 [Chitinophagaceae bacterium]